MTTRRLLFTIVVGILCYAGLFFLSARFNPLLSWNYRLDRQTAIEQAREVAARFGIQAGDWNAYVTSEIRSNSLFYLSTRDPSRVPIDALLSPASIEVQLINPTDAAQTFLVNFTTDGRATLVRQRMERDAPGSGQKEVVRVRTGDEDAGKAQKAVDLALNQRQSPNSSDGSSDPNALRLGGEALNRIVGVEAERFRFVSERKEKVGNKQGVRLAWERTYDGVSEFKTQASALVVGDMVREVSLTPDFVAGFETEIENRQKVARGISGFGALLTFLLVLALPAFYFIALLKRRIRHRQAITLFLIFFLAAFTANLLGGVVDSEFVGDSSTRSTTLVILSATFKAGMVSLFVALGFALVWAVGQVFARRTMGLRIASFVALLRGKLATRFVGASIASGVMLGGALAIIPFLIRASNLFPGFIIYRPDPGIYVTHAPVLAGLLQSPGFQLFALYGFLLPALSVRRRLSKLARILVPIFAAVFFIEYISKSSTGASAVFAIGTLALLADFIFRRYDLLSLFTALFTSAAASVGVSMLAVESPALNNAGYGVFAALGVIALGAAAVSIKGRTDAIEKEVEVDPTDEFTGALRVERERLVAEFGVARQAQQRMLPNQPPQIPGYEIAASCRPAREVGGDLYDFLRLPDERIGIVVADVSGKGVPAALYMTLTKGLLASVAESETDPHRILREVNRHLYEVCRRKVFVTLVLGVLDPATRTLHLARAGHNPTVWRRVREGEVRCLRAPGLGLGLNKGAIFDRTLKIETIQLNAGDAVLFYSDGITEAMNAAREEYGEERLRDAVEQTDGMSAAATEATILGDVFKFLGDTPPQDDVTLVVLRVGEDFR